MGNYKWDMNDSNEDLGYVVVLFISRNKDNKEVQNFKERRQSLFCTYDLEKIGRRFDHFVEDGVPGEMCRLYVSVNKRNTEMIRKKLLHLLIDKDDFSFDHMNAIIAGLAAQKECATEKKWMFDFDCNDENKAIEFIRDIVQIDNTTYPDLNTTPNGFAIIARHGFDTRELFAKWNRDGELVSVKKDDLLCRFWMRKDK